MERAAGIGRQEPPPRHRTSSPAFHAGSGRPASRRHARRAWRPKTATRGSVHFRQCRMRSTRPRRLHPPGVQDDQAGVQRPALRLDGRSRQPRRAVHRPPAPPGSSGGASQGRARMDAGSGRGPPAQARTCRRMADPFADALPAPPRREHAPLTTRGRPSPDRPERRRTRRRAATSAPAAPRNIRHGQRHPDQRHADQRLRRRQAARPEPAPGQRRPPRRGNADQRRRRGALARTAPDAALGPSARGGGDPDHQPADDAPARRVRGAQEAGRRPGESPREYPVGPDGQDRRLRLEADRRARPLHLRQPRFRPQDGHRAAPSTGSCSSASSTAT